MPAEQLALDLGAREQQAPAKPTRTRSSAAEPVPLATVDLIAWGPQPQTITVPFIEQPPMPRAVTAPCDEEDAASPREPFGLWLLQQTARKGWIGDLAKGLRSDPGFPKRGSPDDVRKRLREVGADGDAFEALDDAERAWLAL